MEGGSAEDAQGWGRGAPRGDVRSAQVVRGWEGLQEWGEASEVPS